MYYFSLHMSLPRPEGRASSVSGGAIPFDKVKLRLGGPPSQGAALLNAARLGLEVENDIRVSAERLAQLRHPNIPFRYQPPPIHETIPMSEGPPSIPSLGFASPDDVPSKLMPLL